MPVTRDVTCLRCGCTCNDLEVEVIDNEIAASGNACEWGKEWLASGGNASNSACLIHQKPATIEDGIAAAADFLSAARYPLIYGLCEGNTDSQRLAIAIAEKLGGVIDLPQSQTRGPSGTTFRGVGEVTATLGEVRHRGDLVIFWRCDPAATHPRHMELYSLEPRGEFLPKGRADRTCVVIGEDSNATIQHADLFLFSPAANDFEALWLLRSLLAGVSLDEKYAANFFGSTLLHWRKLAELIQQAKYVSIFYDQGLTSQASGHIQLDALHALVKDLNRHTRAICRGLGSAGNPNGAEQVLTWTTGYPTAVDFSRGYPRYSPGEFSAREILSRGEADALLLLGSPSLLKGLTILAERKLPIIFGSSSSEPITADVVFQLAKSGVHVGGTTYRVDGVPLPLRPPLKSSLVSESTILQKLLDALNSP